MFNERLEEALKNKKMTGNALCVKMGVANTNYTNWKNNKPPKSDTLKEIAEILEVSTDWLLERERAPTPEETKLLTDYRDCDDIGRETICSIADLQAKRCRKDRETETEDDELKPFA